MDEGLLGVGTGLEGEGRGGFLELREALPPVAEGFGFVAGGFVVDLEGGIRDWSKVPPARREGRGQVRRKNISGAIGRRSFAARRRRIWSSLSGPTPRGGEASGWVVVMAERGWKWKRDSGRCVFMSVLTARCWYLMLLLLLEGFVAVVDVLGGGACLRWFTCCCDVVVGVAAYYSGGASLAGTERAKFSRTHEKAETRKEPINHAAARKERTRPVGSRTGTDRDRVES